jgi:hypothetical protein
MNSRTTRNATISAAILFAASLFAPSAHAQTGQAIIATIPFQFSINSLHFKAGSYRFNLAPDRFGMSVINLETGKKRFITVRPHGDFFISENGFLVFKQSGNDQYLSEVHFSGSADSSRLTISQKSDAGTRNTILRGALPK